jgi:hypothetical protein
MLVELSSAGDGLSRRGFAGDTFNTAWTLRGLTDPAAVPGTAALADEPDATRLWQLRQLSAQERTRSRGRGRTATSRRGFGPGDGGDMKA